MPNTPSQRNQEQLIQQAEMLLQVLQQLAEPSHGIIVALPDGRVMATNDQVTQYINPEADYDQSKQLPDLLGISQDLFSHQMAELKEKKHISKHMPVAEDEACDAKKFDCRLIEYQKVNFVCIELSGAGQPSTLVPFDGDSYHNVFENSVDPLFILDCEGKFVDLNKSALKLAHKSKETLIGKTIFKSFGLNLFERVSLRNQLNQVLSGRPQRFEWWLREANNDLLPIEISLQMGTFRNEKVVFGYAKNLYEVIGFEQEVRIKNTQLEFVNQLITNLSTSDSQHEVLNFTLDEILEKADVAGGCVYSFDVDRCKLQLTYSAGVSSSTPLPEEIELGRDLLASIFSKDRRRALSEVKKLIKSKLQQSLWLVPVLADKELIAFIPVWPSDRPKVSKSFLALLDFIGNAIGNYISRHQLMQQLTLTKDKYKLLFEESYDAILMVQDGIIVECNDKALELFRCSREDLIGHSPRKFAPAKQPDGTPTQKKADKYLSKVMNTNKSLTFEWQIKRKDGTIFDSELNVSKLVIDNLEYMQVFIRDITQRKQDQIAKRRQEVVRESIDQFRNFLDKVNLVYYSLDTEGNLMYANDYFLSYVEYSRNEIIGKNFYDTLVPEQDRQQRKEDFQQSLRNKKLNSYYERDLITKSGQLKTIRWNCMFEYSPDGEIMGVTSVGKDMTDKRIAMEALKDNKIRLQDLFDNAHDLIQNISVDNKFIFVNKAWKERLGYTDEDIEELSLNDIVHPYYKAKLIYQLRNLYKGENVNKIETVFLTKAGKPVHLIGSITCSWQDGRPVATRAILHDITDRIKAERLQKVYYSIANLAISSKDLNSLYSAIHRELSKIIETRNIYIALCDGDHKLLNFVYLVDQYVDQANKTQTKRPFSIGLSEFIIETGKPLYMQKQELIRLAEQEKFVIHGAIPEVMLCSPLSIGDRIIGVITLQDYQNPDAYVHTDIEILHFISNQVALAIERKRNEEQINTQNARLNAIFESGSHHMWSLNRKFELTSFNQNFANTFERRSGNKLKLYTRLNSDNMEELHENRFGFWEAKYEEAFEGKPQHFEVHLTNPESWREVYLHPIYLEDGTIDEISGIALDITDKKKSQLALAENEEKFRHVFESFQDVYYRSSIDGILELVSPSIYNLLGYHEEEVIGKHTNVLYVDPTDREQIVKKVLRYKSIRDFEVRMVCKDGSIKDLVIDSRLSYDSNGKPIGLEGVARDVSELKKTQVELLNAKEEAENLLKVKTQFLANMSHELRTPMNGIIGMIDLLSQINTDPEQSEYIDTLRKSSDALLEILNDILDLSKIQAGKLVIHESGIDLHETLDKVHNLFANRAQQKDLQFTYSIAPDTPRYILTDETRLLQILSNLTSNAIKFTNSGEVSIKVAVQQKIKDTYQLCVRVKDSGIGITKEDQALLFTDFTQLDNSSTKTFGGTGLGLAISKQLAHLLGGDIGVESVPEGGSIFWFTVNVRKANEQEVQEQQKARQKEENKNITLSNNPQVLLVDDNQINQKVAWKQLERLGCETDIASNGYEAIEHATKNTYDIIFMDIQMPEMDGVTATKHIKEILGEKCPPIIAMTAYSMKDDAAKFMAQGMDDYISKPVKSADLYNIIVKWEQGPGLLLENGNAQAEVETAFAEPLIIDTTIVEQLRMIGGEEFTKQLYAEFEQEAAELLEEAKKELQEQQYKSILSTLHQLKGTGFTLGINPLAETAKQLEHDIKQEKYDSVEENFVKLLTYYENYRKAYKDIII